MLRTIWGIRRKRKRNILRKYDLKGDLIAKVTLPNTYQKPESGDQELFVNKDYIGLMSKDYIYIVDNKGNVVNKIEYKDIEAQLLNSVYFNDNDYSVLLQGSVKNKENESNSIYQISKYDSNHKLIEKKQLDKDYATETLKETGYEFSDIMDDISIVDGRLIELMYSSDDNGTEAVIIYE